MIDEQTRQLSAYRLEKAGMLLTQAEILLNNRQYDGSVNRSYYAIFNAVRALLALVRLDSQRHRGIISFFDRYFVKSGLLEKRFSTMVHEAFDTRQDNDYEDFYQPTEVEAQTQFKHAMQFLDEIRQKHREFLQGILSLPTVTPKQNSEWHHE